MRLSSPYERLQELMGLIDLEPTVNQVVRFFSAKLDPMGEVAGVAWMVLAENGTFDYARVSGLRVSLNPDIKVSLADDNAVAFAMRTHKSLIFDMATMHSEFRQATHQEELSQYLTGVILPITERIALASALNTPLAKLKDYEGYFECVRLVLTLWQSKIFFKTQKISKLPSHTKSELTSRQEIVISRLKEGKTNREIARELGFSESLIRQETIIIYSKLGISGRKDFFKGQANPQSQLL